MKYRDKCDRLVADNRRLTKKLIDLTSSLNIYRQKCLTIESAFDLSQKLVQHLKTENQLLRSSAHDLFPMAAPLTVDTHLQPIDHTISDNKVTDQTVGDGHKPMDVTTNEAEKSDQSLFKSDLIAIEYENEIRDLREDWQLLSMLDIEEVLITREDQINASSHLTESSESEPEPENRMEIDFDAMSISKESESISDSRTFVNKCKYCGRKFAEESALNDHKLLHKSSDGQQVRCAEDLCGFQFDSKHDLHRHLKTVHKNHGKAAYSELMAKFKASDQLKCKECGEEFKAVDELRSHSKSKHNIKTTFKCKFSGCDKSFEKVSELRAHEKVHRKQNSKIELKGTPNKTVTNCETNSVLTNAENTPKSTPCSVAKPRDFPCLYEGCTKSFVHKTTLKRHVDKVHGNALNEQKTSPAVVCAENGTSVESSHMAVSIPVQPQSNLMTQMELLNAFYAAQQKQTEL